MKKLIITLLIAALTPSHALLAQTSTKDSEAEFRNYLESSGTTITNGNKIKLFFNGHDKFVDLFSHIRQAQDHVHLEYFNFRNDSIAMATFDILGEMTAKGVTVRAMFDAFGNSSNNRPLKKQHIKEIKNKGIDIVKFDPIRFPWVNHVLTRDHRKIVVIDGKTGYTGGMNIADYYINGLEGIGAWHDIHARIEGPAVKYLQDIFLKTWNKETHSKVEGSRYYPNLNEETAPRWADDSPADKDEHTNVCMSIVDRSPGKASSNIRNAYAAAINAAKENIQIVNPYFVPTHKVRKALKRAIKRGVRVEIMIPSKSDIGFTPETAEYITHKLMKRGADIYLFNGGFHHSKIMMVDDVFCTVGTANLNSRSLRYDYETNAFIFDKATTNELTERFEQDKKDSTTMDKAYWKKRSSWKKFVGWLGNILTPFL